MTLQCRSVTLISCQENDVRNGGEYPLASRMLPGDAAPVHWHSVHSTVGPDLRDHGGLRA
eukprot:1392246-Amorphochlora_amoeboformis.AAC.2